MTDATATATDTAIARINAYVTPCEHQDPPNDWAGYVAERLAELHPTAEISVEYAPRNHAHAYGADGEPVDGLEDEFAALSEQWWTDLCEDPDHEQWTA